MNNCLAERPIQFTCHGKRLYGILHLPENEDKIDRIILMIVGGPQTRIGAHRLFVQLARQLSYRGIACLRFDYEGLGDSEGEFVGFRHAGPSIRAAINYLYENLPRLKNVVIWSLCDGSTASAIYAQNDRDRIAALILCNPYIETEQGKAKTFLKYYYTRRIVKRDFWLKTLSFNLNLKQSIGSFISLVKQATHNTNNYKANDSVRSDLPLPDQITRSMVKFNKPIRFLLSTNDLTALEFKDMITSRKELSELIANTTLSIRYIKGADHTFSTKESKRLLVQEIVTASKELNVLTQVRVFTH